MKSKIIFGLRFISFICVYLLVMILVDSIFPSDVEIEPSLIVIMALFAQILVNSTAIVYLLHRLRFKSVKQILFTSLIVYGIQIFMTQMETWIFIDAFPMFNKTE